MKNILLAVLACWAMVGSLRAEPAGNELEHAFLNPPPAARPGALWMWMGCNLSREGITRDLEALKSAGFNRTTMFSLADVTTPWAGEIGRSPTPEIVSWTEPWWKLVRHAAEESRRLGMDFGMFNGPSYESSGGPWITPEQSMQEVCFSQKAITGGAVVKVTLDRPKVDARAVQQFPVYNPETGKVEKPEIPARRTFYRDIAVLALPAEGAVAKEKVIDLSGKMTAEGKLEWDAPAGQWLIYRFGHTTMGTLIQPAQWKATGLECDKMSREAVEFHMKHVIGEIQKHLGDLVGTGFTHVHFDSYEAGTPGWTPKMRQEFATRRGYDMTPFLATLAGRVIGSEQETGKFRGDFHATIQDLYRDAYFTTIQRMLHDAKLEFLCEPYGGPWRQDEVMPKVDRVMTEFWTNGGRYTPFEVGPTIAALRKSGQNVVEAEAFTGAPGDSPWRETPAWLKPMGDAAYCDGINRFVVHRFVQQPWDDRYRPGATMGQWGTHFDRTQTWWEPGKAMVAYWTRCQAMLQWGKIAPMDFRAEKRQGGVRLQAIHRSGDNADAWFVANVERAGGSAKCIFKVTGRQPELWDPVRGTRRDLTDFTQANGQTSLALDFAPTQSFLIVFRRPLADAAATSPAKRNIPQHKLVAEIAGAWEVEFDPKWGGPARAMFDKLEDWTNRPEPGIRYYSGTAMYRKSFDVADGQQAAWLDLGTVNALARVTVNGKELGVVWCPPWGIEIPAGLLKARGNELQIAVTNVWANRLIGDEQEPADCQWLPGHQGNGGFLKEFPDWFLKGEARPSKGRYCFTTWNYFSKDSPLVPSGLVGPVRLMSEDWTPAAEDAGVGPLRIHAETSDSMAGFEDEVLKSGLLPMAAVVEEKIAVEGGGKDASALTNGTMRNGSGGEETLNDGKTFRSYGAGSVATFRLDTSKNPAGYDVAQIRTFAGHPDGRASQAYRVLVATAAAPARFVELANASIECAGGSSMVKMEQRGGGPLDNSAGVRASGVAAVRFEFRDGPLGYSVYREIDLVGAPTTAQK